MRNTLLEDQPEQSPSDAVLQKVAAVKKTEPMELDSPLYEVIDPDALDALFADKNGSPRNGRVSFTYSGCEVRVESDGEVLVRDLRGRSSKNSGADE